MPITNLHFEDGIFFAEEVGNISKEEAEQWVALLTEHARNSPTPIVAVVDALQAGYVTAPARQLFADASFTPNLIAVCVAAQNVVVATAGLIGMMGEHNRTYVFYSVAEARAYAEERLKQEGRLL
jgi:hypothetical protein